MDIADPFNTVTLLQPLRGSGTFQKLGLGKLALSADTAYTGNVKISQGTLQGTSANFLGNIETNAQLVFAQATDGVYAGNISGTGTLGKEGPGTLTLTGSNSYSGGTTVFAGTLKGNTGSLQGNIENDALVVFDQASSGTYSGRMNGSGSLIKQGNGLLVFNGTNTYTGGTEIQAGNLQVGDADHAGASIAGNVFVDPAGILSGHGTVNGTVQNFGIISPGGSIGTLKVTGNVAFNPGSAFRVEISPTQASQLDVTGRANLGNAPVTVIADPGTYSPRSYTILRANPAAGRFSGVRIANGDSIPSLGLLSPTLGYFSDRVDLNLEAITSPVSPAEHVTRQLVNGLLRTIGGRLDTPLGESCNVNRMGFWARGVGMLSSADADRFAPRYDAGSSGSVMGFDGQFGENLSLGIAGFAGNSDVTIFQTSKNHGSADSALVSLYGSYTPGAWQAKSVVAYDNDTFTGQRNTTTGNTARAAQSKTYGNRVNSYSEFSYTFRSKELALQPMLGIQAGWMRQNSFSETGPNTDGQNLSVNGRTLYTFDTLVGLRTRYEASLNPNMKMQFEVRTLYDHDFGTLQESVGGRLSNGQVRLLATADRPQQRDAGIIGASVALLTADSVNLYLDYNGDIRGGQQAHFISAGLRYAW